MEFFGGVEIEYCARSADVAAVHRSNSTAGPVAHVMFVAEYWRYLIDVICPGKFCDHDRVQVIS